MTDRPGLSVVVISYDRPKALDALLGALLEQRLGTLTMELIVCNNAGEVHLSTSPETTTGQLLSRFPDTKVFNSSFNWLCRVRYALATLARFDTIVFIDDDIVIKDADFLAYMYHAFRGVRHIDILSCWTALWTKWTDTHLTKVRMNWTSAAPGLITECDYVGPGLCIFDRRILVDSGVLRLPETLHRSDSAWFPWLPSMRLGTRKYYLPSYGRVEFHPEQQRHALMKLPGFQRDMYGHYKAMWKGGYVPVVERRANEPGFEDSPEMQAIRSLTVETDPW